MTPHAWQLAGRPRWLSQVGIGCSWVVLFTFRINWLNALHRLIGEGAFLMATNNWQRLASGWMCLYFGSVADR